jgi:hypothetical protein
MKLTKGKRFQKPYDIRELRIPSFSSLPSVKITSVLQMARNKVLEELLGDDLAQVRGITEKAMFGGWAWLLNGNLLCGARDDGMLARLGKGNDAWALSTPGIAPMIMQGRQMRGWVRASPEVYEDDALRRKLLKAALEFNRSLPKK